MYIKLYWKYSSICNIFFRYRFRLYHLKWVNITSKHQYILLSQEPNSPNNFHTQSLHLYYQYLWPGEGYLHKSFFWVANIQQQQDFTHVRMAYVCSQRCKTATWELSRYKKYSERVRSSPTGRVWRIYGGRARHLVKTTLMPYPKPVNTNNYSRIAGNRAYSVNVIQNPWQNPSDIDIRHLTEHKCAKSLVERDWNGIIYYTYDVAKTIIRASFIQCIKNYTSRADTDVCKTHNVRF